MNRVQSGAENLIDLLQMVQVGAGEVAAAVAVAALVERTKVMLMFSVSKLYITVTSEEPAVSCVTGGGESPRPDTTTDSVTQRGLS